MIETMKKLLNAINTLKSEGFAVTGQCASYVRLKKNGNWVDLSRDGSSYLAYNLDGREHCLDVDAEDLGWTVEFAVANF